MQANLFYQRISQLFRQQRLNEAIQLAETYLADHPQDWAARIYYVYALNGTGQNARARQIVGPMLEEDPSDKSLLHCAATVELNDDKPKVAEEYARTLIEMDAEDDDAYELMAQAKLNQRNYDAALKYSKQALSLNPDNSNARNIYVHVTGFLGGDDTADAIRDALERNPEDPTTIANHGYQMLREGRVDKALERLKYALSLNPNNQLARHAMLEALRSKFWPYRFYFKYKEAMGKLSGGASWAVIIGLWFVARFLGGLSESNPEYAWLLDPLYYLLIAAFISTWLIDPIMNFYLLTNPYGRLLLNERDKTMAKFTGASLGLSLLNLGLWFTVGAELFSILAVIFLALCIPLGSFLRPLRKQQRQILTAFTVGIAALAFVGVFLGPPVLLSVAAFGLLGYQFLINAMMTREGSRTFGD